MRGEEPRADDAGCGTRRRDCLRGSECAGVLLHWTQCARCVEKATRGRRRLRNAAAIACGAPSARAGSFIGRNARDARGQCRLRGRAGSFIGRTARDARGRATRGRCRLRSARQRLLAGLRVRGRLLHWTQCAGKSHARTMPAAERAAAIACGAPSARAGSFIGCTARDARGKPRADDAGCETRGSDCLRGSECAD